MFTNKDTDDNYTDLKLGDVVVCTFSKDNHFIIGEEYKVIADGCGGYILITENKMRFALNPKQGGYCSTNTEEHWFYKKEYIVIIDKNTETELKMGDTVVCIKGRDCHFIGGKEYKVAVDSWGEPMIITERSQRYALKPKQGGYCSTNLGEHWFRKKEVIVDNELKGGDWVFETLLNGEIRLEKLIQKGENVSTKYASYNKLGINEQMPISRLVRATEDKRQALVVLNGEQAVPKLELTGGEAVKHLLKSQKYVLCWVSNFSETHARKGDVVALIDSADMHLPEGSFYDGGDDWNYAVPVDMNQKEITISLVEGE